MNNRQLETLELRNQEYLLFGMKTPPINKEHKQKLLTNINAFEAVGLVEQQRKDIVIISLNKIITTD